ncbi:MAG: hypothetical protein HY880_05095, partial [Deltaproteobacteria bacterium]|nr:hypothetical protein [Deltaproteobacteria bacterium]
NEQTFSEGLPDLYRRAGYDAIIMDWNNCFQHNHYPKEYLYHPQRAGGITVIWGNSIAFQKFQRYAHGLISLDDYMGYLDTHMGSGLPRSFPLYCNDAEVFDFRPGSTAEHAAGEWKRIEALFENLSLRADVELVFPSEVIKRASSNSGSMSFQDIRLASEETPLPCKKQDRYNPTRWALTGRDTVHLNTLCWRAYNDLKSLGSSVDEETMGRFRETLCFLWASDFRTNTTDEKLLSFYEAMGWLSTETKRLLNGRYATVTKRPNPSTGGKTVDETDKMLKIETPAVSIEFLKDRGLAINSLVMPSLSSMPLIGTLQHGSFEDIHYGADFFSGHLINIRGDGRKVTDLKTTSARIEAGDDSLEVSAALELEGAMLLKSYRIFKYEPRLDITYRLKVDGLEASSLRLGIFTFMAVGFDRKNLFFETMNGGFYPERYHPCGHTINHDTSVSQIVSSSSCLGATGGWVTIGDKDKAIRITTDKSMLFSVPLLHYKDIEDRFFFRIYHSIGETDETSYWVWRGFNTISFTIEPDA